MAKPTPESQANTGLTWPFVPAVRNGRVAATTGTWPPIPWMVVVVGGRVDVVGTNREVEDPAIVVVTAPGLVVELPGWVVPVVFVVDDTGTEDAVVRGVVINVVLWGVVVIEICAGRSTLAPAPADGTVSATPKAPAPAKKALAAMTPIRLVTGPVCRTAAGS